MSYYIKTYICVYVIRYLIDLKCILCEKWMAIVTLFWYRKIVAVLIQQMVETAWGKFLQLQKIR